MPDDLFYISQNGLVIPRFISKPLFSFTFFSIFLLTFCIITMMIPLGHGDSIIWLPESVHSQFQYIKDGTQINFLVIAYMRKNSTIWISNEWIGYPDSTTLSDELSRQFKNKTNWTKNLNVSSFQKKYFQNAGYISGSKKLFLHIDSDAPWGKVVALLRAAQAAGVRDVCFLTEEPFNPKLQQ